MNNKEIGTEFEQEMCETLNRQGYWVHFIVPDSRGAQPFDIIAVRAGEALAIDCKTCVSETFNISRLEDNQIMAFEKWLKCGNSIPLVMVKHKGVVYPIRYTDLRKHRSINLKKYMLGGYENED